MRRARGSAEGWQDLSDEKHPEDERKKYVALKWAQFLTKYLKVRKLQLLFRTTGNYLNESISRECRERVSRVYSLQH